MGDLEIYDRVLEIFNRCFIDIRSVSWRYLIGVLEIFDRRNLDI